MQRIYDERRKGSEQQVVQSAGEADNVFIAHSGTGAITIPPVDRLAQQQKFHFHFLHHTLKQAEWCTPATLTSATCRT